MADMQAVSYRRYSPRPLMKSKKTRADNMCVSIETQDARIRPYCEAQGWQLVVEREDREKSGGSTEGRPGLEEAIAEACSRKAVLVVYSLSRLARSTRDAIDIAERLNAAGAHLASLHERIDTTTAMGRFVFRMMASLAELEREQTAERTSDAMLRRQADGEKMGGVPPAGKMLDPADPKRYIDCPDEQDFIKAVLGHAEQGKGSAAIRKIMVNGGGKFRGRVPSRKVIEKIISRHERVAT